MTLPDDYHGLDHGPGPVLPVATPSAAAPDAAHTQGAPTPWDRYLAWNRDVALAVYPAAPAERLVFLDLEGDSLDRIAERRGLPREQVVPALVETVTRLLDPATMSSAFRRFARATDAWHNGEQTDPPPGVALLALFSLAAERMKAGDGIRATNYYGQLARLLDQDTERMSLSYRESSPILWDSLTHWLTALQGRRGRPVTFSIGHFEYIGRAMAQALVRDTDRRRLESFFVDFDLSPHSDMTTSQLLPLLDAWLTPAYAPAHLSSLWAQEELRHPLTQSVAEILRSWDGTVSASDSQGVGAAQIRLALARRSGLQRGWSIWLTMRLPRASEPRTATIQATDGGVEVSLVPSRPGELQIQSLRDILTPDQLVTGRIDINDPIAGRIVSRVPRSIVVLRREEASADWIEVSQVRLGDEVAVLAREDQSFEQTLREVSATAWTEVTGADAVGIPQGWRLVHGVTVAGRPTEEFGHFHDLSALIPITHSTLSASGGLRLPGHGREWRYHADRPPTVTVARPGGQFDAYLFDLEHKNPIPIERFRSVSGEPRAIALDELGLEPGSYGLRVPDSQEAMERRLWLHDSAHPTSSEAAPQVPQNWDGPLWAINAYPLDASSADASAPRVDTTSTQAAFELPPPAPWWRRSREAPRRRPIQVAIPDSGSCAYTGRHHEQLEDARPDSRGRYPGTSLGVCITCGRTKRYSNSYWSNTRRWNLARNPSEGSSASTQTVSALGTDLDWNLLLDALLTMGSGSASQLRGLTQQFDPSARFYHEVAATLSDLGQLELVRDPATCEVRSWAAGPPSIAVIDSEVLLLGGWPRSLVREFIASGAQICREPQEGAPDRLTTTADATRITEALSDLSVTADPARHLARRLPPLSAVVAALPAITMPSIATLERYEPSVDRWEHVTSGDAPGAYRADGYSRLYLLRTEEDVRLGAARVANVALAKHAAPVLQQSAQPLLAYDRRARTLSVPLGALLPGEYSRAATLASGRTPRRRDTADHSLVDYLGVPPDIAAHIYHQIGA